MTYLNRYSDLANSWQMARASSQVRAEMDIRGRELSTGALRGADVARAGGMPRLVAIDRSLDMIRGYETGLVNAQARADAMQASLSTVRSSSADIMVNVLSLATQDSFLAADIQASEAISELGRVVAALNVNVAGHSLFSGAATDQPAVTDAPTLLADVEAILAAAPDVATALANVDFYFFDPAGGYMATSYTGATQAGPDVAVREGDNVSFDVRADDMAIRGVLRNLAVVAGVANGAYTGSLSDLKALYVDAGQSNLAVNDSIIRLQEGLGYAQERMAEGRAFNEGEKTRLELARTEVANTDPYEAAARFQELEAQLERIYTVTARMAQLSLVNFMR